MSLLSFLPAPIQSPLVSKNYENQMADWYEIAMKELFNFIKLKNMKG